MSVARTVVRRPVTMLMIFVVAVGLGLVGLQQIAVDFFPEIKFPVIVVSTRYRGSGPEEVEASVTRVLEGALSNVGGIEKVRSSSSEEFSTVTLNFAWGTDLVAATNDIRDRLELVAGALPKDAGEPRILKFDPSGEPIMEVVIRGDLPLPELRDIARKTVKPRFERVVGVGEASIQGGQMRQVRVDVIQNRLQAFGITMTQLQTALGSQNREVGGGRITEGERNLLLRTTGEFTNLDEIRDTVVASAAPPNSHGRTSRLGRPVLLRDIADVSLGLTDLDQTTTLDGDPSVYVAIRKESGANSVKVADAVRAEIERIAATLPAGVALEVAYDDTSIVRSSLDEVVSSMLIGLVFATAVLFVFLRNGRTTMIIAISVPVSFAITLAAIYFSGRTLNVVSLSGLIMGLGMIVDASIVVLENIHTHRMAGMSTEDAATLGTQEMFTSITASALTTISVFLPIVLLRRQLGVLGVIFGEIAFTIIFTISASLLVAVLLVPVLAATYVPLRSTAALARRPRVWRSFDATMGRWFDALDRVYAKGLRGVLAARGTTLFVAFAILAASLLLIPRLEVVFSRPTPEDSMTITVALPIGTRLAFTEAAVRELEALLTAEFDEHVRNVLVTAGDGGLQHTGEVTLGLLPLGERTVSVDRIRQFVRANAYRFPGIEIRFDESAGAALSGSSAIDVSVISDDRDAAGRTAYAIQRLMLDRFPQITEPRLSVSDALPQLEVVIDRLRAYAFGLSVSKIAEEVRANVQGTAATRYRVGGDEIDVFVALREEDRSDIPDLERIVLRSSVGDLVPLSNFATLRRGAGPITIERENERRIIHVTGGLAPGNVPATVEAELQAAIAASLVVPEAVQLSFTGEQAEIGASTSTFLLVLAIAVVLVFAVMAGQFESFRSPFIIVFTIPLMVVGAIGIYFLLGQPFSMFSFMGLIMLAGLVVNNGIVLVDYTNLLRVRGMEPFEACIEAGRRRLRPVLMTTLTTMLGMTPLAFFPGEASVATQPVALTIVGGLFSSTLMTLFVVPVLYSLIAGTSRVRKIDPAAPDRG